MILIHGSLTTDGCSYASTSLLAIVYVLCFFSETLTWQQQQHNVAASVIMTTNLNWQPGGGFQFMEDLQKKSSIQNCVNIGCLAITRYI
jgi:hypothetical protein